MQSGIANTVLSLASTSVGWSHHYPHHYQSMRNIMSKGQDSKKNAKKKPLLTPKEKKAAKTAKKAETNVLGNWSEKAIKELIAFFLLYFYKLTQQ